MPSRYEKDITININGNATGLSKALKTLDGDLYNAKQNIKAIDNALKLDPSNVDLAKKKFDSLNEILELTKKKLEMLKQAQIEADTKGIDKNSQSYKNLASDISKTTIEIQTMEKQLKKLDGQIDDSYVATQNFSESQDDLGDALAKNMEHMGNFATKAGMLNLVLQAVKEIITAIVEGLQDTAETLSDVATTIGDEIVDILGTGVEYDATIENYKVRLASFAQIGESVNEVFEALKSDALKSPFSVDAIVQASTMLLSTGKSFEEVRQTVLALGDAVAKTGGDDSTLTRMAQNLQQISNAGKASAVDLRQFAYAGIDIYGILKEYEGIIYESASETPVSFEQIADALAKASEEGGKYFEGMSILADTYTGKLNKLSANWSTLTGVIAESTSTMLGSLISETNNALTQMIDALENGDLSKVNEILQAWIQNCLDIISEQLPEIITFIGDLVSQVITALNNTETIEAITDTLKVIINTLGDVMNKLTPQIKELFKSMLSIVNALFDDEEIRSILTSIAEQICEIVWDAFWDFLWGKIKTITNTIFGSTFSGIKEVINQLSSVKMTAGNVTTDTSNAAWSSYTGNGSGTHGVTIVNNNNVQSDVDVEAISKKTAKQILIETDLK